MRRIAWLCVLAFILVTACTPTITPLSVEQQPPAAGVGVCHYVPGDLPDGVGWGYETSLGRGVLWRELEPQPDVYDFSKLDAFVRSQQGQGVRIWLAIQTGDEDLNGVSKAPAWLAGMGAVWHKGSCSRGGIFAPWDPVYQERLAILLHAVGDHLAAQDQAYRDTLGGIVMMSGGLYGELQLWSCQMEQHLQAHYNLSDADFLTCYGEAVRHLLDLYAGAFDLPVMFQLGYHATTAQWNLQHDLVEYAVQNYPEQVLLKWNGLDPGALANDLYVGLFREYGDRVGVGFEAGHPSLWTTGNQQEAFDVVLEAGADFVCLQGELLDWTDWRALDAAMEGATPPPTPTPPPQSAYMVGWYSSIWYPWLVPPQGPPSADKLEGFAQQGMPLVLTYTYSEGNTADYLDEAQRVGISVIVEIPRKWTGRGGPLNLVAISTFVTAHKDHPALWGWYTGDEPEFSWDASGQQVDHWGSPQTLGRIYDTIKATGDQHPVTIVNWARPRPEYAGTFDVYMNDWYPRDCKLPGTGSCTGSADRGEFNWMVRASYNVWGQGIAFAEQNGSEYIAVAWGQDYDRAVNPKEGMRDLTRNEFRYHVYSAVVQGADGVLFWKEGWADAYVSGLVYEFAAEVQSIGAAMNNGTTNALTVSVPDSQLVHRYGSSPDSHVILAVNITGHDNAYNVDPDKVGWPLSNVSIQLPYTARPAMVEVVGEDRSLPVTSANTIIDTFDRYQVHIYRWPWGTVPTPTPLPTWTPTPQPTPTSTPTLTPSPTPMPTSTATPTPTRAVLQFLCDVDLETGEMTCRQTE